MSLRSDSENAHNFDYQLVVAVTALLIIGLMMIYSATFALGYELEGQPGYFFMRQVMWTVLGGLGLVLLARIEYHTWRRYSIIGLAITLLLLGLVLFIGNERFGGRRWLFNGSIQPSELTKLVVILYIADWLSAKGERIRKVTYGLIPFAILLGLVAGLIMLQRDLSTSALIILTTVAMFFIAGGNLWQILASSLLGGATFGFLISQSEYRLARITAFLDPLSDPLGSNYQVRQILIALGSGGVTGVGLGVSRQKFGYIPASHTDGIFAILGEELGLIGGLVVIALFAFLAYRGFRIALAAPDTFGAILASGLTCSLIFQTLLNIGVITATLPFTGIPLPFISFGGSSLVVSLAHVGLLLAVSRRTMPETEVGPGGEQRDYAPDDFRRRNRRARVPRAGRRARA
ncbi:MAG: putative lipid II flippase FtsW [Anaerolineae bacterium]